MVRTAVEKRTLCALYCICCTVCCMLYAVCCVLCGVVCTVVCVLCVLWTRLNIHVFPLLLPLLLPQVPGNRQWACPFPVFFLFLFLFLFPDCRGGRGALLSVDIPRVREQADDGGTRDAAFVGAWGGLPNGPPR